ncbi:hypothetical protein SteCoe_4920 [Stentor coeruleus]|uniref:Guanylate cyclase domain-containing protein n=1 Tax=Stentor coeruleus TaxID=5963 RepID=A0A1R2CTP0_9CILI|nr:hypothetical protein SteCoe_4920 [Stentor coeruleus]
MTTSKSYREIQLDGQIVISETSFSSNSITICPYTYRSFIFQAFINQFYNIPYGYFISMTVIDIYFKGKYINFVLLSLLILFGLCKEFFSAWELWKIERKMKSLQAKRWNGNCFERIFGDEIFVGNILEIEGEALADVVILAGEEKIGVFEGYVAEGEWKEPVKEIKKIVSFENSMFLGISRLFGTVEVEEANGNFGTFDGKIKLRGRTNSYKLQLKNILYQGSKFHGKILGLVVYTGKDTKFSCCSNNMINSSFLNSKLSKISAIFIFILIIYTFFSVIGYFSLLEDGVFKEAIVEYFLLYENLVPISAFIVIEIIRIFNVIRFKFRYKKAKVNNIQSLENAAKTEIVAVEENCVLDEICVKKCYIGDTFVDIIHEIREEVDNFTLTTERCEQVSFCRPESQANFEFWKLLLLSTTVIKSDSQYIGSKDEISLIKTIENLGFEIHTKTQEITSFLYDNNLYTYHTLQISTIKSRTRLIVSSNSDSHFISQGYFKSILPIFSEESKEKPTSACDKLISEGLRPLILCSKPLPEDFPKTILEKLDSWSHSSISQKKKLEKIMSRLEQTVDFLGVIGLQDKISDINKNSITKILSTGVKILVFSSRNKTKSTTILNIIDSPVLIPLINFDNEVECYRALWKFIIDTIYKQNSKKHMKKIDTIKELDESNDSISGKYSEGEKIIANHRLFRKFSINPNIDFLKKPYGGEKRYAVLLDKMTLDCCMKSDNIKRLLVCVLYAAEAVVICDIMPEDSVRVVKMMQENVKHKPVLLALAGSKWALPVCQSAGIGVTTKDSLISDISGLCFGQIPDLLEFSKSAYLIVYFSIFWEFFKSTVICTLIFLCQSFTSFSAYSFISPNYKIMFDFITSIQLVSSNYSNPHIFQYLGIGIILLVCVLIFTIIPSFAMVLEDGRIIDADSIGLMIFIVLTGSIIFLCFLENRSYYLYPLSIAVLIISTTLNNQINLSNSIIWIIQVTFGILACISLPYTLYSLIKRSYPSILIKFPYSNFSEIYTSTQFGSLDTNSVKMHNFTMKYKEKHTEDNYKQAYINESLRIIQISIAMVSLIIFFWAILNLFLGDSKIETIIRFSCSAIFFLMLMTTFLNNYKKHYIRYTVLLSLAVVIAKFVAEISGNAFSVIASVMIPAVTYLLFNVDWVFLTYVNILSLILSIISAAFYFENEGSSSLFIIYCVLVLMALVFLSGIVGYILEKHYRNIFKLAIYIRKHVEKNLSILEILLPEIVIDRVKAGVKYIADDQGEVTIIFCDICDFEQLCNEYQPSEFSSLLDSIFSIFDELCENYGITKIETVGKTYMACSGMNKKFLKDSPSTRLAIDLAIDMIKASKKINLKTRKLSVKIGINTGQVTSGVVGFHKPQFSLVGDTVNTASRMCSTLESSNSIQISMATFMALESTDGIEFTPKKIMAKGKGEMNTFIVREGEMKYMKNETYQVITGGRSYKSLNWRQSVLRREDTEIIRSVWWLGLNESTRQREYRVNKLESKNWSMIGGLVINNILQVGLLVLNICGVKVYGLPIFGAVFKSCVLFVQLPLLFLHSRLYKKRKYQFFLIVIVVFMVASSIKMINAWPETVLSLELCFDILFLNHMVSFRVLTMCILNGILLFAWFLAVGLNSTFLISEFFLLIFFSLIDLFAIYRIEEKHLISYNLQIQSNKEIRETEHLLVQMMPAHIVHSLSEGVSITEKLNNITILYADIVGFTAWSSNKTPKEVIQMLSNLFTEFDKKCVELNVYKVHTIGDCYVVMGYLSGQRDPITECLSVFRMAQNMINIINRENQIYDMQLSMRIGIHTGDIIAGVIGNKVVRYDIWGNDVLVANKMESNGKAGEINISEASKHLLENILGDEYEFAFNKDIGRNPNCKSYFVIRK